MKKKLAKIFNTIPEESSSYKAIFANLDARGKVDMRKMIDVVVMIIEEIEDLKLRRTAPQPQPKPQPETKAKSKAKKPTKK